MDHPCERLSVSACRGAWATCGVPNSLGGHWKRAGAVAEVGQYEGERDGSWSEEIQDRVQDLEEAIGSSIGISTIFVCRLAVHGEQCTLTVYAKG